MKINLDKTVEFPSDELSALAELALKFSTLEKRIEELCPNSRERSLAITNLQQALLWVQASISWNAERGEDNADD